MPASVPAADAATTARRVVLLPVSERSDEVVRRYRLACLRLDTPAARAGDGRFDHLKRSYD